MSEHWEIVMSGGFFDYVDYRISEIVDSIAQLIYTNKSEELNEYGETVGRFYSDETIKEFQTAVDLLKRAQIYAHRVDYLVSGDDSENCFHSRLKEDLENND